MNIFDLVKWGFEIVVKTSRSVWGLIGMALAIIGNVSKAINNLLCRMIDLIAEHWPQTPDDIKLGNLLSTSFDSNSVGSAVVGEVFSFVALLLVPVLIVKVYKLIPLKAT